MTAAPATIRVLLVDGDPDDGHRAGATLERHDDRFDVEVVATATEGLDRLDDDGFDCVVSEYRIPDMDGVGFLEAVREDHPDLPFVLFTGDGSEEVASEAIAAGVTDYIPRDSDHERFRTLVDVVENAVGLDRSQPTADGSEARFRDVIDALPHALFVVDEDGRYLVANEALAEFHGASVEEIEGASVDDVLTGPERDRFMDDLREVLETGEPLHVGEVEVIDPDGDTHVFDPRLYPYDVGEDRPAVLGITIDVTEIHRHERVLEETSERMRLALEGAESWIWDVDIEDGTTTQEAVTGILGIEADRTTRPVEDFLDDVHPEDRDQIAFKQEAVREGEPYHAEYRLVAEDEVRWIESRGKLHRGEDGPDRIIGIATDITERKQREQQLQRQNERLDEFASVLSHDLRNPLTVIAGRIDLARQEVDSEHLEAVQDAVDRMEAIIEDVLTLARDGDMDLEPSAAQLGALVDESWHTVDPETARLDRPETLGTIVCDPDRVRRLLENLFRNAVEHGGDTVAVGLLGGGEGFYVADDGPGIPASERDDVFERGYTTGDDHTGFGLAIVEEIATAHGWDVHVTEGDDGGARFEVRGVDIRDS